MSSLEGTGAMSLTSKAWTLTKAVSLLSRCLSQQPNQSSFMNIIGLNMTWLYGTTDQLSTGCVLMKSRPADASCGA